MEQAFETVTHYAVRFMRRCLELWSIPSILQLFDTD